VTTVLTTYTITKKNSTTKKIRRAARITDLMAKISLRAVTWDYVTKTTITITLPRLVPISTVYYILYSTIKYKQQCIYRLMNFEQFTTCFSSSNKYLIEQYPLQPSLEFISTEKWNNIVLMIVCNIVVIHISSLLFSSFQLAQLVW